MNFTMGGVIVAGILDLLTLLRRGDHNLTSRVIWNMLPVTISFTITTGVAPLLFMQVMFGQFFYPANVFLGFNWFAIVPLLIVAFYVTYVVVYRVSSTVTNRIGRWDHAPGKRLIAALICAALFIAVAMILTTNHMLSIQPDQWAQNGQWQQNRIAVTAQVTHTRLTHTLLGAIAVGGLLLAGVGGWRRWRKADPPEIAERIIRAGLWAYSPALVLAAILGVVLLFMMPKDVWQSMFTPTVYTAMWWVGVLAIFGQAVLATLALQRPAEFKWFAGLAACVLVTLIGMLGAREAVRFAYLARNHAFTPQVWDTNVHPQVSSLILFAVMLIVALGTVAWLLWVSARARRPATADTRVP
jgi:hypothetical protein